MLRCVLVLLLVGAQSGAAPPAYPFPMPPANYYPGSYPPPYMVQHPTPHPHPQHGIHVAEWNWDKVGLYFTFTAFIVVTGLSKVGMYHRLYSPLHRYRSLEMHLVFRLSGFKCLVLRREYLRRACLGYVLQPPSGTCFS